MLGVKALYRPHVVTIQKPSFTDFGHYLANKILNNMGIM